MAQNQSPNHSQDLLSTYLLVVGDTQTARDELGLALMTLATAKVKAAVSMAAAVAELQVPQNRVDLAIIDLDMSGSAAVTLTRKLRDPMAFRARNIAILLIGGAANTPHYLAAARLGIQGHLPRPITAERLRQAVRAALLARPLAVAAQPAAARREDKPAVAAPVAVVEATPPHVPVENKPFRYGLQSLMKVAKPLTTEEAFGFEAAPPVKRRYVDMENAGNDYGEFLLPGRRLSAVG